MSESLTERDLGLIEQVCEFANARGEASITIRRRDLEALVALARAAMRLHAALDQPSTSATESSGTSIMACRGNC